MKPLRHLLTVSDLTAEEVRELYATTKLIKKEPARFQNALAGKTIGLIFEKPSTRTWVSFQAGMAQLGGSSIYLGPEDIHLGKREATKDIARVLGRYLDGMALRTFSHQVLEEFAAFAQVPVINGLSNFSHPCQALTDLFTVEEEFGTLAAKKIAFVGDGNNVLNSLLTVCAMMGVSVSFATPKAYPPHPNVLAKVRAITRNSSSRIEQYFNPEEAVKDADVVYTDVWVSMGEEKKSAQKKKKFRGFQVNAKLLKHAKPDARIMHCLPAHRGEEITDEALESKNSMVFDQAENRLHVQKAILLKLIEK